MTHLNGLVHLWELPKSTTYIRVKDNTWGNIFAELKRLHGTNKELGKRLGISGRNVQKICTATTESISLENFTNISEFLVKATSDESFGLKVLEKELLYIRTKGANSGKVYYPKFPIDFNSEDGGKIIGALLGDGGVRKDMRPFYTNKEKERIFEIVDSMEKVVGKFRRSNLVETPSPFKPGSIVYSYDFYKIIGRILRYGIGMSCGDKVVNDPALPEFCFASSVSFKKNLIRAFFTDEAHVHRAGVDLAPQITLRQVKLLENKEFPRRLVDIGKLLASLGLKPTLFFETSYGCPERGVFTILLSKLNDTRYFYENIGFSSPSKMDKLRLFLETTKRKISAEEYHSNRTFHSVSLLFNHISELTKNGMKITSSNIASLSGKNRDSMKDLLKRAAMMGLVELQTKGKPLCSGGRTCDVFHLSEKGRGLLGLQL